MSTRSTIGIRHEDGSVTKIYCHWDGYIEWNGAILQKYYNTADKEGEAACPWKSVQSWPGDWAGRSV